MQPYVPLFYLPNLVPCPLTIMQILDRPAIFEELFSYHKATVAYCVDAFDINVHLRHFFDNPVSFHSLQASTGTLIYRSVALQFLDRTRYHGSNLDLYTHPSYAKDIGLWLTRSKGYTYRLKTPGVHTAFDNVECIDWCPWRLTAPRSAITHQDNGNVDYYYNGLHGIYFFGKTNMQGKRLRVQTMSAYNMPLQCIMGFHSSVHTDIAPSPGRLTM